MHQSVYLRLPDELHRHLKETCKTTGLSANSAATLVYRAGMIALSPVIDAQATTDALDALRDFLRSSECARRLTAQLPLIKPGRVQPNVRRAR